MSHRENGTLRCFVGPDVRPHACNAGTARSGEAAYRRPGVRSGVGSEQPARKSSGSEHAEYIEKKRQITR